MGGGGGLTAGWSAGSAGLNDFCMAMVLVCFLYSSDDCKITNVQMARWRRWAFINCHIHLSSTVHDVRRQPRHLSAPEQGCVTSYSATSIWSATIAYHRVH